jgi:hypothetical protein
MCHTGQWRRTLLIEYSDHTLGGRGIRATLPSKVHGGSCGGARGWLLVPRPGGSSSARAGFPNEARLTPRFGPLSRRWSERNTQPVQTGRLSFRDGPILDSNLSQAGQSSVLQKDALKTMRKKKASCLPVVDGAGALKGILSIDDILLHAWKARGKKSRKLISKDAARAFQTICKPRLLKLARSGRERKQLGRRSETERKKEERR